MTRGLKRQSGERQSDERQSGKPQSGKPQSGKQQSGKPQSRIRQSGELALIEMIRQRAARMPSGALRLGIGDDCAILRVPPGQDLLVTTDFSLEGRHFRRDCDSAQSVGHRCLARGLSDLAAMGARPMAAFLSLALPKDLARGEWVSWFFDGLLALAEAHGVPLAGGDTAESPNSLVLADIILLGSAPAGRALRRSGARAGDALYVTGALGGAAAELALLSKARRRSSRTVIPSAARKSSVAGALADGHPHIYPQPRLLVGMALLRRRLATSCIDVSDGLSTDLAHLCAESKLCAEVEADALPVHALAKGECALKLALHGGEDYELLFTASAKTKMPARIAGVPIARIGRMVEKRRGRAQMTLIDADGRRKALEPGGWEHFS